MTIRVRNVRYRENVAAIERVAESQAVADGTLKVADSIAADTKAATSGSRRLRQFGRRTVTDNTDTGARVGTTWGPAVPVEFGTIRTPAHRILTTIAGRYGRTEPGR